MINLVIVPYLTNKRIESLVDIDALLGRSLDMLTVE